MGPETSGLRILTMPCYFLFLSGITAMGQRFIVAFREIENFNIVRYLTPALRI
jgi:hypothetical protein